MALHGLPKPSTLIIQSQGFALPFPTPEMASSTFFTRLTPTCCMQSSWVQLRHHFLTFLDCPRLHLTLLLYTPVAPCVVTLSYTWLLIYFRSDRQFFINVSSADTHKSYVPNNRMNGKMYGKGLDSKSVLNKCSLAK